MYGDQERRGPVQPASTTGAGHVLEPQQGDGRTAQEERIGRGPRPLPAPPDELEKTKKQIGRVTAAVLGGEVDRSTGAVVLQGFNVLLRSIEIQRKLDRQAELEDRLLALEDEVERRHGSWPISRRG